MILHRFIFFILISTIINSLNICAEDFIKSGDSLYKSFDNERALIEYNKAYEQSPNNYYALIRLVRLHNDMGRIHLRKDSLSEVEYRKAIFYADTLLKYYPDSAATHFWFGLAKGSLIPFLGIKEKLKIGKEVKQYIQKAVSIDSAFSFPYVLKAIFEREGAKLSWFAKGIAKIIFGEDIDGSLEESEQNLKTAIQCDTNNSFAYYELFWTYKEIGDKQRAKDALQKVITFEPKSFREKQQQEEALKHLKKMSE